MKFRRVATIIAFIILVGQNVSASTSDEDNPILRGIIVAGSSNTAYALDTSHNTLYELGLGSDGTAYFREMKVSLPQDVDDLPFAWSNTDGPRFYFRDEQGVDEIGCILSDNGITTNERPIVFPPGDDDFIYADNLHVITSSKDKITLTWDEGSISVDAPDGDLQKPVAASTGDASWFIVWPERLLQPEMKITLSEGIAGYGEPGVYKIKLISRDGEISSYTLDNPSYKETRASGLIGIVSDPEGKLYIIDNKGYLTVYDGTDLVYNRFIGLSASDYALNTVSKGPNGSILVSDSVSGVVNMVEPASGDILHSWRLPFQVKTNISTKAKLMAYTVDIIFVVLIIILLKRIVSRLKRHRAYREGGPA